MRMLAFVVFLTAPALSQAQIDIGKNMELRAGKIAVRADIFSVPVSNARLKVLPTAHLPADPGERTVQVSVRDLSVMASMKTNPLSRPRSSHMLIANGGFSTSQPDRPLGLLVSEGRTVSIPNYQRLPADPANPCIFRQAERFKYSGLICVKAGGAIDVGLLSEKAAGQCTEGLQAGPVLVEEGRGPAICAAEAPQQAVRTALCKARGPDNADVLKLVVTRGQVSLFDLAQVLAADPRSGGLGCYSAVNLSGADSSGAAYFKAKQQASGPTYSAGDGLYPQASFLVITSR